jgi:hypothetical protein
VVLPSVALRRLVDTANRGGVFGYICPVLINAPRVAGDWGARPPCTPGSLIHQDAWVRRVLLDYYDSTTDVLDQDSSEEKVWETAFLTSLFDTLKRPAIRQSETVIYHLDYHEGSAWIKDERTVIARSRNTARELAQRNQSLSAMPDASRARPDDPRKSYRIGPTWWDRARRALRLPL